MKSSQVPTIPEFFRDREIFITGGTGFLGKAIIEKILYSCPDVHRIYLLMRCKKGVEIYDRMKKFKDDQIFNRIKERDEKLLNKLIPVAGDLKSLRLGLSDEDLKKMENVSVILNSAATVRFDEALHDAILTNTRSARELVLIAEKLKNLKILVHISTTFCNPTYKVIEEEVYPPLADWRQAIKLAENLDEDTLNVLSEKYMNFQPNTYTFTKGLTEQIMKEYSKKLPIIIFRPSIISPSVKEPYPGWVDNFNGLAGIIAIGSSGLGRVFYNSLKINANCQPLDVCVRSLLVATWKHSLAFNTNLTTYNCACNKEKCLSTSSIFNEFYGMASKIPVDEIVWHPSSIITPYYILYKILFFFFQIIPGIFFDMIFRVMKKKPIALKILRKFYFASVSLSYFMFREWDFLNKNLINLMNDVKPEDKEAFAFDLYDKIDEKEYAYIAGLGGRRYLLKQKDENLPRAKRNYKIFWFLDRALKATFGFVVLWFFIVRYDLFNLWSESLILK